MFWYSWQLTLITLAILAVIVTMSILIVPLIRARLNHRFSWAHATRRFSPNTSPGWIQSSPCRWSRNEGAYGDYLSSYLVAGFNTRQLSNTYSVVANALEQLMTLLILCGGAWIVMQNAAHHRHAGRVPDVRRAACRSRCCAWSACGRSFSRRRSR